MAAQNHPAWTNFEALSWTTTEVYSRGVFPPRRGAAGVHKPPLRPIFLSNQHRGHKFSFYGSFPYFSIFAPLNIAVNLKDSASELFNRFQSIPNTGNRYLLHIDICLGRKFMRNWKNFDTFNFHKRLSITAARPWRGCTPLLQQKYRFAKTSRLA